MLKRYKICRLLWSWLLLLGLSGCAVLLDDMPAQAPAMTQAEEASLGELTLPVAIQRLGGRYTSPLLAGYLDRLGAALASRDGRQGLDYQFVIADQTKPCLYTLPAGKIIITRGLLSQLQDEADIAAVLKHAILRNMDPPFSGVTTRGMVEAASQIRPKSEGLLELDAPVDRLVRAILKRDERNVLDLGAMKPGAVPLAKRLLFAEQEKQAFDEFQGMQFGYRLLEEAKKLEQSGRHHDAIERYLQAGAEAPEQALILLELGMAYLRADDLGSARIYLQKAFTLQPDYYRTRMGLGYIMLLNGDLESALAHLRQSARLLSVTENFYLLGQVYEKLGRLDQATPFYRAIIEVDARSKLGRAAGRRLKELEPPL